MQSFERYTLVMCIWGHTFYIHYNKSVGKVWSSTMKEIMKRGYNIVVYTFSLKYPLLKDKQLSFSFKTNRDTVLCPCV